MADTTREILDLEGGAACRLRGTIPNVFPMASGEHPQHGVWYRQDFILKDEAGEIKVSWWNPGPAETMTILRGATVMVEGKVNRWVDREQKERKDVRATGPDAIKPLDGSSLSQPSGGTQASGTTSAPPQGQKSAQKPSSSVERQGPRTDKEYVSWLAMMASQVGQIEELAGNPQAIQAACATAWIDYQRGGLELTYGMERSGAPPPASGETPPDEAYDDDSIPF